MTVPFSNLEDILYSHNEEMAEEIFEFLVQKGYTVALSSSVIKTYTHGEQVVKRLDVHKKKPICKYCGSTFTVSKTASVQDECHACIMAQY